MEVALTRVRINKITKHIKENVNIGYFNPFYKYPLIL